MRHAPGKRFRFFRYEQTAPKPARLLLNGFNEYWMLFEGVWYLAGFRPFPPLRPPIGALAQAYDAAQKRYIMRAEARTLYGRVVVVAKMRKATRAEIARYCK